MVNKEIYLELKNRIVFLDYKPKKVLNIKLLAKEFGVSPMPIRDVLILLESEKLITVIPNNGIYVNDISLQELKDVFEIRIFLIGLSGKLAAQRIIPEELNKLKELLKKIKQEKNRRRMIQLEAEFHDLVNYSTKNQTLAETLKRLRNQIGRLWFLAKEDDAYLQKLPNNLEELIKALENKEQIKAEQILKSHAVHFIEQIKTNLYNN